MAVADPGGGAPGARAPLEGKGTPQNVEKKMNKIRPLREKLQGF